MNKLLCALVIGIFAVTAQAQSSCEDQAVSKDGKPLAGAAKAAFIKKCTADKAGDSCEAKAVSKDGKPLAGAAKTAFLKKCEGGSTAAPASASAACEAKAVGKNGKALAGAAKDKFMKKCVADAGCTNGATPMKMPVNDRHFHFQRDSLIRRLLPA